MDDLRERAKKIKILVGYHQAAPVFRNDILTPIHLGRALAPMDNKLAGSSLLDMPGDDTGDNISGLNQKFCEMTAIYWAWKNYAILGEPDYLGLMHYRRLLDFVSPATEKPFAFIPDATQLDMKLISEKAISSTVPHFDLCIKAPVGIGIKNEAGELQYMDVATQYRSAHHIEDLMLAYGLVAEKYPHYAKDAVFYLKSKQHYLCNMFIMRKDYFFSYAEWIFDILFEVDKRIDYVKRPGYQGRALSFLAERLTAVFFLHAKRVGHAKTRHLRCLNINCY